jgi:hypothetical protein
LAGIRLSICFKTEQEDKTACLIRIIPVRQREARDPHRILSFLKSQIAPARLILREFEAKEQSLEWGVFIGLKSHGSFR